MSRAPRPAAPIDDLLAHKQWPGSPDDILTPDLVAFCEGGRSIIVGARDADGRPVAGLGLAARIQGDTVRLILRRAANEVFLQAVARGDGLAVTFSEPTTHRSIQLKGLSGRTVPLTREDEAAAGRQCAHFREELTAVGYAAAFSTVYCSFERSDLVVVAFEPAHAFVQTPGPGAGSALRR